MRKQKHKTFCQDIKYSTEQEAQNSKMLHLSDRDVSVATINMVQCLVAKVNVYSGHFQQRYGRYIKRQAECLKYKNI